MREECFEDVVRSNDIEVDDMSNDLSPEERAFYEDWPEGKPFPTNEKVEVVLPDFPKKGDNEGSPAADDDDEDDEDDGEEEVIDDRSNQQLWKNCVVQYQQQ